MDIGAGGEKMGKAGMLPPSTGISGKEIIGGGNLYSGYSGRLGMSNPPKGRVGNCTSGKAGKVVAKSFRVANATSMLKNDKAMKKAAKTKTRGDAITIYI